MGSLFSGFLTAASLKSGGSFDVPVQLAAYAVGSIARKLERKLSEMDFVFILVPRKRKRFGIRLNAMLESLETKRKRS